MKYSRILIEVPFALRLYRFALYYPADKYWILRLVGLTVTPAGLCYSGRPEVCTCLCWRREVSNSSDRYWVWEYMSFLNRFNQKSYVCEIDQFQQFHNLCPITCWFPQLNTKCCLSIMSHDHSRAARGSNVTIRLPVNLWKKTNSKDIRFKTCQEKRFKCFFLSQGFSTSSSGVDGKMMYVIEKISLAAEKKSKTHKIN